MFWAVDEHGDRVRAEKGARAVCPGCGDPVRAHCGELKAWHWHHEMVGDCDPWHEPETQWHLDWKARFPAACCEIWERPHRADVINDRGTVIEFQHSPISAEEIKERETFWQSLVWVFDARGWFDNLDLRLKPDKVNFRWKHPHQSLFAAQRPMFLDTGTEIFHFTFLGRGVPCGGSGRFLPYRFFIRAMVGTKRTPPFAPNLGPSDPQGLQ